MSYLTVSKWAFDFVVHGYSFSLSVQRLLKVFICIILIDVILIYVILIYIIYIILIYVILICIILIYIIFTYIILIYIILIKRSRLYIPSFLSTSSRIRVTSPRRLCQRPPPSSSI